MWVTVARGKVGVSKELDRPLTALSASPFLELGNVPLLVNVLLVVLMLLSFLLYVVFDLFWVELFLL